MGWQMTRRLEEVAGFGRLGQEELVAAAVATEEAWAAVAVVFGVAAAWAAAVDKLVAVRSLDQV